TSSSTNCVRNCSAADPGPANARYRIRLDLLRLPRNLTDCFRPHCITGDGVERALLSVNRQLSGPGIHVCEGDTVIAEVHNFMEMGEGTSVHWHGMHQVGTQHMDGVSMVTQCPINAHFVNSPTASPAGTHYWHSHSGLQRSEGIFGPLVVRQAADPHAGLYDTDQPEHTLLLSDWFHELGATKFAAHHYSNGDNKPKGLIINAAFATEFAVISNAILNCPFVLSVANHSLLVIATDGAPVVPIEVDSLIIYAGERFDFVLTADRPPGNYLLMVAGLADCDSASPWPVRHRELRRYRRDATAGRREPSLLGHARRPGGRQLNPFNRAPDANHIDVTSLRTPAGWPPADHLTIDGPVDAKFYLAFDFEVVNNSRYHHPAYYPISAVRKSTVTCTRPQINNVALHMRRRRCCTQFDDVLQSHICNNTDFDPSLETEFKACHHGLRLGVNKTVELVLIDKGFTSMPATHSTCTAITFALSEWKSSAKTFLFAEVKRRDSAGLLRRNLDRPVMKDT
uniref:Plastocyanin-like domain-containing protein n=1 Tax=Macrostomum lignano TaxID=282301 RepID=A0A1I8JPE7_9PLAT